MGADTDTGYAIGKDLASAFQDLIDERAYYYGHGGYTGTFAETPGAIYVGQLPARVTSEQFEQLIQELGHNFYDLNPNRTEAERAKARRWHKRSKSQAYSAYSPVRKEWVYGSKPFKFDSVIEEEEYTDWRGEPATRMVVVGEKRRYSPKWPASFKKDPKLQHMAWRFADLSSQKWEPAAAVKLNAQERATFLKNTRWHGKHQIDVWFCQALCSS